MFRSDLGLKGKEGLSRLGKNKLILQILLKWSLCGLSLLLSTNCAAYIFITDRGIIKGFLYTKLQI